MAEKALTPLQKAVMLKEHYVTLANWMRTQLGTTSLLRMGDIVNSLNKLPTGKTVAKRWGCMVIPLIDGLVIGRQYIQSFQGGGSRINTGTFNTSNDVHRYVALQFGFRDSAEAQEDPDDPTSRWRGMPFVIVAMFAWDDPNQQWRIENSVVSVETDPVGAEVDYSDLRIDNLLGSPDTLSSLSVIWPSQELELTYTFPAINLNVSNDTETIIKQSFAFELTMEVPGYGPVTNKAYLGLDRMTAIAPLVSPSK